MKNKKIIILLIIINIILVGIICSLISKNRNIVKEKQLIKEMSESIQVTDLNNQINALNTAHTEYSNYIQTCKTQIAKALTNEGVTTSDQATLETMSENIGKILQARTADATATADNITEGYTAYVNGEKITGIGTSIQNSNLLFLGFRNDSSNVQNTIPVIYYNDEYLSKNENGSYTIKKSCDVYINSLSTFVKGSSWGYVNVYINNTLISSINGENPSNKLISYSLNIGDVINIIAYSQTNGYSTQQNCCIYFL